MTIRIFKYSTVLLLVSFLLYPTIKVVGQSENHDDELLKADALATAYVNCDHDLTFYNYKLKPEDKGLKTKLNQLKILKNQMFVNMQIENRKDDTRKKKFEREVNSAKKQLNKCIKYQNILDANAEAEKQKAKESK